MPRSNPTVVERELVVAQEHVLGYGCRVTQARVRLAGQPAGGISEEFHALSMPDATLYIDCEPTKPISSGCEAIVLRLQPHPHASICPLGQGTSGGELSRVMLALKPMLGHIEALSTLIFSEIDAGIGGQTAIEVGARLKRLAQSQRVIVVTHLAQVATFDGQHLVVEKNNGTTKVYETSGMNRRAKLTHMMGGDPHSATAHHHASQVLIFTVS